MSKMIKKGDPWCDRPELGRSRPTPERMEKGAFVLRDTEDAGVTVAVDEAADTLDRLHLSGVITPEQCLGGHDFAALMGRLSLAAPMRSCLDDSGRGYVATSEEPTEIELRDTRERQELYLACGVVTWRELYRVAVEGRPVQSVDRLRFALDLCVKFWG